MVAPSCSEEFKAFTFATALNVGIRLPVYPMERWSVQRIADPLAKTTVVKGSKLGGGFHGAGFTSVVAGFKAGTAALVGKLANEHLADDAWGRHVSIGFLMSGVEYLWTPCYNIKVKMQSSLQKKSFLEAAKELGLQNSYRGSTAMLARNSTWHMVNMPLYAALKKTDDTVLAQILKGSLSAQISTVASYPFHVMGVRQAQLSTGSIKVSALEASQNLYREGGFRAFYRGFALASMRMAICGLVIGPVSSMILEK